MKFESKQHTVQSWYFVPNELHDNLVLKKENFLFFSDFPFHINSLLCNSLCFYELIFIKL